MDRDPVNRMDRTVAGQPLVATAEPEEPFTPVGGGSNGLEGLRAAVERHKTPLAVWTLICLALAIAYIVVTPSTYTASSEVLLEPRPPAQDTGVAAVAPALDSAQAESQIHVVHSERVLRYVFDTLDLANSPAYARAGSGIRGRVGGLLRRLMPGSQEPGADALLLPAAARARAFALFNDDVDVRRIGQSYVLEIQYRSERPDEAARISNAIASAYLRDQVNTRAADAQRGIEYLQGRIALLKTEQDAADAAIRSGSVPPMAFPDAEARVISAAMQPLVPSAPQKTLLLVFSGLFGLLSGLGVIVLRHKLDRTIRTPDEIWDGLRLDCLGAVPVTPQRQPASLDTVFLDPASAFSDAMRTVRVHLLPKLSRAKPSAIGIVGCGSGAGATTLAANLAILTAASGEPVALVDGDLRQPTLSRALAAPGAIGLPDLLARTDPTGPVPLVELGPHLSMLPPSATTHPGEENLFLGSAAMQAVVTALRAEHLVLIDLPALDRSPDAPALAPLLDGVVLVAEAGRTTVDDVAAAVRSFHATGATLLGVILNKADPPRR